jgi:hypothetical protein
MARVSRNHLTVIEIYDLINGDNPEIESDNEESEDNELEHGFSEDDLSIEHAVAPGLPPPSKTTNHHAISDELQMTDLFIATVKKDIKWRRKTYKPNPATFHRGFFCHPTLPLGHRIHILKNILRDILSKSLLTTQIFTRIKMIRE